MGRGEEWVRMREGDGDGDGDGKGGEGQTNIREADHMRRPIVGEGPLQ